MSHIKKLLTERQQLLLKALLNKRGMRELAKSHFSSGASTHQISGDTSFDRYPKIFTAAQTLIKDRNPRLLSFGCSTGEEVITLRRYFPEAEIVGSEVNPERLAICQSLPVDEKCSFIDASEERLRKAGPFDGIFCMAVLQRFPTMVAVENIQNIKFLYPFAKFEEILKNLDLCIRPGGVIFITNAQYRLNDTCIADSYEPVLSDHVTEGTRVFDKQSDLIKNLDRINVGFQKHSTE